MNIIQGLFLLISCCCLLKTEFSYAGNKNQLINFHESYGVEINSISMKLDKQQHDVRIAASWDFKLNPNEKDYIDSNLVVNDIKKFLINYPNSNDYWEVINHKLGLYLLKQYPQLATISITIQIPPSTSDAYPHYSKVVIAQ